MCGGIKLKYMAYKILIDEPEAGDLEEPRKLAISDDYGLQLQIEQDGQDAYIDLVYDEAKQLANHLTEWCKEVERRHGITTS